MSSPRPFSASSLDDVHNYDLDGLGGCSFDILNESSKNILKTLTKKREYEKKALDIVIDLIDGGLEEVDLLNKLHSINPCHYKDVVEERFILKQCGYVMCEKKLEYIPNQKYKISLAVKKVYDITDRKKFCSNICFKSSKYLQNQLLTTPLWFREEDTLPKFKLLNVADGLLSRSNGLSVPGIGGDASTLTHIGCSLFPLSCGME